MRRRFSNVTSNSTEELLEAVLSSLALLETRTRLSEIETEHAEMRENLEELRSREYKYMRARDEESE